MTHKRMTPSRLLASLLAASALAAAAGTPLFNTGDRWLVLGDSITHNGWYYNFVELFFCTRYPGLNLQVLNAGVSGDTAEGANRRWETDCLRYRPTVVSVMLGMNDFQSGLYRESSTGPEIMERREKALEHYASREAVPPDASMDQRLQARITRLKGQPQEAAARQQLENYYQEKPREAEYLAQLETLQQEVWQACRPVPHTYALTKE